MNRADLTEKLLDIKREKGWTWKYICEQIGGMSPVMITGGVLGQQKMTKPMAAAAAKLFGLSKSEQTLLNEVPMRGTGTTMPVAPSVAAAVGGKIYYIGDTVDDARCARAAGVPFIGIAAPSNPRYIDLVFLFQEEGAYAIIDDINFLQEVFAA